MLSYDYVTTRHKKIADAVELHWDSPQVEAWMLEASETQQNVYEMLGGKNIVPGVYSSKNRTELERKVAYALYGPPEQLPNLKQNLGTGYKKKQLKIIRKTSDVIMKKSGQAQTAVSFLFICIKLHDRHLITPLFKIVPVNTDEVGIEGDTNVFVDGHHRVYHGWDDYLKKNRLPRCFMCYPRKGTYTETDNEVDIDFGESPSSALPEKVFNALDITTTLVATALGITALALPVSAPIAIAATVGGLVSGIFGLTRSAKTLVDRHKHGQTLGLNSEEARSSWLSVVGNTVGMALGGVNMVATRIIHGGRAVGLSAGAASLSIGATALKGLTIVDHFANIGSKLADDEQVTMLDAFQLVSSVFFFTGSVVSTQTAFGALQNLKASGVEVKMAEVLRVIQSRSDLQAEVMGASRSVFDGEELVEEPEMFWPTVDDADWKCTIL